MYKPRDADSNDQSKTDKDTVTLQFNKLGPRICNFNAVLVDREHLQQAPNSNLSSKHLQQLVMPSPQPASAPLTVRAQDILPVPRNPL